VGDRPDTGVTVVRRFPGPDRGSGASRTGEQDAFGRPITADQLIDPERLRR
jgi:hypothetical protein